MVADRDTAGAVKRCGRSGRSSTARRSSPSTAIDIRDRKAIQSALAPLRCSNLGGSISSSTPPRSSRLRPTASSTTMPGRSRSTSTSHPTSSWPKKPESCSSSRVCRRRWCLPARPTRSCPSAAAKPMTFPRPHSVTSSASLPSVCPRLCALTASVPATVVKGSTMFPRDRVKASLTKYNIPFEESQPPTTSFVMLSRLSTQQRTLTHVPIDPKDNAEAILFLAGPQARCTTGHLIPVDGGSGGGAVAVSLSSASRLAPDRPIQNRPIQNRPIQNRPIQDRPIQDRPIQNHPIQDRRALIAVDLGAQKVVAFPCSAGSTRSPQHAARCTDSPTVPERASDGSLHWPLPGDPRRCGKRNPDVCDCGPGGSALHRRGRLGRGLCSP